MFQNCVGLLLPKLHDPAQRSGHSHGGSNRRETSCKQLWPPRSCQWNDTHLYQDRAHDGAQLWALWRIRGRMTDRVVIDRGRTLWERPTPAAPTLTGGKALPISHKVCALNNSNDPLPHFCGSSHQAGDYPYLYLYSTKKTIDPRLALLK